MGHRNIVDRLLVAGGFYDKDPDIAKETKVLEEVNGVFGWPVAILLEVAIGERKLSSVGVRSIRCCGDGHRPFHEIPGAFKVQMTKDVLSAAGCPGFGDQSTTSEGGFIVTEVIKDFVDGLDG